MLITFSIIGGMICATILVFYVWTRFGAGSNAPRIGMSLSRDWYDQVRIQPAPYSAALARAGANVRTIEPEELHDLDEILAGLDGVILIGGGDVDPELFGGDPAKARRIDRVRDDFEIELLRRAEALGLPVMGVCRGSQLLAVAHGGKLQSLKDDEEKAKRHGVTLRSFSAQEVTLEPGTRLHEAMGEGPHTVSSTHLQAIADPGSQLKVAARSTDGVIEAVELPGDRFVVCIQWHPELESLSEELQMTPFRLFVEAARNRGKK